MQISVIEENRIRHAITLKNREWIFIKATFSPAGKPFENDTLLNTYDVGKELDEETGLYYYGARYLDPKTSRWLSTDPAMAEYIPQAPINDEARKRNQNLPGLGGIFNYVNFHVYHYGGNNPIKYTDPDGRTVTVQIHHVGVGHYHASIKITLDKNELEDAFKDNKNFSLEDKNGKIFLTIGAGPKDDNILDKLEKGINRPKDVDKKKADAKDIIFTDVSEEKKYIEKILAAYENYDNSLDYGLFARKDSRGNQKYNSNSFVSGLFLKAGLLDRLPKFKKSLPGYYTPIPIPDPKPKPLLSNEE